jgi:hypothetical protein
MGPVAWSVVTGLIAAVSAAVPWLVYANPVVPSLARSSARPPAYYVAAIPAAIASVLTVARLRGFSTGSVRDDVILIAAIAAAAAAWGPIVRGAMAVTGGPTPQRSPGATSRDGARARSARGIGTALGVTLFLLTLPAFAVSAAASFVACLDTERILAEAEPPLVNPAPIEDIFANGRPEAGARFLLEFPMSLELAASNKSYPAAYEQLVEGQFVGAQVRRWMTQDGNGIEAEVMQFATPEGAATYQGQVNRYACGYANEAFSAPMGGIGLQVRYEIGAPYVEQISWVAGNRRYQVQISAYERPVDHSRILSIQETATAGWPTAPAPTAEEPVASATPGPSVGERLIDEVRAAAEATLAEGTVYIKEHVQFQGSVDTDGVSAFNGLVGLGPTPKLQGVVKVGDPYTDRGRVHLYVTVDDTVIHVRGRTIDPLIGEDRWLVIDTASQDPRAERYAALLSGQNDPSMALYYLLGVTSVVAVSDDIVRETPAHRYTVEIDLQAAVDALPPQRRERLRAHLAALRAVGMETDLKAEIWVPADGMVHHVDYVQGFKVEAGGGRVRSSFDMFDFGVEFDVDPPAKEHVTPLEEVKRPAEPPRQR